MATVGVRRHRRPAIGRIRATPTTRRVAAFKIESLSVTAGTPSRFSRLARLHVLVGETDQALDALEQALEQREVELIFLATDPRLDDLRGAPRFDQMLAELTGI